VVQIVYSSRRGSRDIEHIGSAHEDAGLEVLKPLTRRRLAAGQDELDLGLPGTGRPGFAGDPLPVTFSQMRHLQDALSRACAILGLEQAAGEE
jgi:hypothetical protein